MSANTVVKNDSFNSSYSPKLLRSDSSFEIIDDDENSGIQMAHNSLSPLRTGVINPLQDVILQNKQLKELLEDCNKKMSTVKDDQDVLLDNLEKEKNKCNALEDETLRLQVEITSLHQKLAEVTKERDDAIKNLLPASPVIKSITGDQELSAENNNKERIRLDAMRQAKMELLVKNFSEAKQELEECQRHLKSKDNDLLAARKKVEEMRSRMSLLEETLAEERERKVEKENRLNSMQRSVTQLNAKLAQESSTYDEEIKLIDGAHNKELNNMRADYNKRLDNLQQMNTKLQQQLDAIKQDNTARNRELETAHKKEVDDLNEINMKLNKDLGALKVAVQEKEATLSRMESERKSMNETIDHLKLQIQSYGSDFDTERHSREELAAENAKLKEQNKDFDDRFRRVIEDYTTERSTRELLATNTERLAQEIKTCKDELTAEKQAKDELAAHNEWLRKQVTERDEQIHNLANEKEEFVAHVSQLMQQIHELQQQKQGGQVPTSQGNDIPRGGQPPPQQTIYAPPLPLQQGIGQTGIPHHLTNASTDIQRGSNIYTPPHQQAPPEHINLQRRPDDAGIPPAGAPGIPPADAPGNYTDVRFPPPASPLVCPICNRTDFLDYTALQVHAEFCY